MHAALAVTGATSLESVAGDPDADPLDVVIADGRITGIGRAGTVPLPPGIPRLDARGFLVTPGLVDLQVNGGHGIDLTDEPERLWELAALLPRYGVTAFLPTMVSTRPERYARAQAAWRGGPPDGWRGAQPIGWHFEGPMLNPVRAGAHDRRWLCEPSAELVDRWGAAEGVALVTLAPELAGATAVVAQLRSAGVVVSAGHTDATAEQLTTAADDGIACVTHLFNAMSPFAHRAPGVPGAALAHRTLVCGLIADGLHVHPTAVALALRTLGPDRLALVTDAVSALGLEYGRVPLGSGWVSHGPDGVRLPNGTLAGSSLSLDQAVRNLIRFTGARPLAAITTVTRTPARLLRNTERGELSVGSIGDLVLFDPDLAVGTTVIGGEVVWRAADFDARANEMPLAQTESPCQTAELI